MLPITRGIVVASTVLAALVELYLAETVRPIFWIAVVGFAALVAWGSRVRSIALRVLLPAMYLSPAILIGLEAGGDFSKDIVWLLPLLGLCLSGARWREWSLPPQWQWPLITLATLVSIVWPIVFLREADFALWILPLERVSNTSIGISPWQVDLNVVYFVLIHNAGILFIDALFRWYAGDQRQFRRDVLVPLAVSAAVSFVVACYQGFVDLSFLNTNFWTYMIRASGTLADPNKLGAVCGFWTVGAMVLARKMSRPWSTVVAIGGLTLGVAATWLCGSRTGLASVTIAVVIAAFESMRSSVDLDAGKLARRAAIVVLGAIALVLILNQASTHTVWARGSWTYIPFIGDKTIKESVNELLWERFGYGPAAIEMIKEHPLEGVGPGMFHTLSHDFGEVAGHPIPQPDNAQAWWRHNLSELGVIGFMPLLLWCVIFAGELFRSHAADPVAFGMLRGVLIAFFIASLFGMPSQSMAIVITFWVFVFWTGLTGQQASRPAGRQEASRPQGPQPLWSKRAVIAAIALIAVHVGATTVNAFGDLRPRERAQRFNWYYRYGFYTNGADGYDREPDPGGNPIMRRWTMKQSLAVIPVKGKVLKFVAWVDHFDADTRPVHTQVWADSKLVYEGDLRRTPLFLDIPATPGKTHMVLETAIDRTWRPSEHGNPVDSRDLGLSIRDWTWE